MKKNEENEKAILHREFMLYILDSYDEHVCVHGEHAVWKETPDEEWENLKTATACVMAHFNNGTPIPQDIMSFLRFAVDMNIASGKVSLWMKDADKEREHINEVIVAEGGMDIHQMPWLDTSFRVSVDAGLIIEDIQTLVRAVKGAWEEAQVTVECLCELLDSATLKSVNSKCKVKPSASTVVAPSCQNGVLCFADGSDIPCAAWKPVSMAMSGGCLQCPDNCPYRGENVFQADNPEPCEPNYGRYKLYNGMVYDGCNGEDVLNTIWKATKGHSEG